MLYPQIQHTEQMTEAIQKMNRLGANHEPFLFIIDFNLEEPIVLKPDEAESLGIRCSMMRPHNGNECVIAPESYTFHRFPLHFSAYQRGFDIVQKHLLRGDTYLANLTYPTRIETSLTLDGIYSISGARYKLMVPERFVVFSPERFVRIVGDRIMSHPMKGTIDASLPNAEQLLLTDEKEKAEHTTIVDLIRNDLGMVARNVRVERFRYIDRLHTSHKDLLQMSSIIAGDLEAGWRERIGDIIARLLPAGSVTGAPKRRTVEIIREAEGYDRGFYAGVMGMFDGVDLDSAVMIRFIEKAGEELWYKSGGGITARSDAAREYQELIDKVYVPID
jgi:para-aminobenzoate synthetase component 1